MFEEMHTAVNEEQMNAGERKATYIDCFRVSQTDEKSVPSGSNSITATVTAAETPCPLIFVANITDHLIRARI